MKKILLIASAILFSVAFVSAQSDTTRVKKTKSNTAMKNHGQHQGDSAWHKSYPNKDMMKVNNADIPASLRTTLQGTEYNGWETGTVYQNSRTKEYSLQLPKSTNTGSTKHGGWYRFDQQGKAIPDTRKP